MRLLLVLSLWLVFSISQAAEIRVASAANFYLTLNKIAEKFTAETGHKIVIIRGSTGKLYTQIINGAPYDIFLSADSARADRLVEEGKTLDGKSIVYAIGLLALWMPDAGSAQQIENTLMQMSFNKLSIANPKTAPYGKAAVEALSTLKIYDTVKNKLVYGENISQALQFVESGAATIGFVARSNVIDDIYWPVDASLHQPIEQKMVLLKQAKEKSTAIQFMQYMQTKEIKKLIELDGYTL